MLIELEGGCRVTSTHDGEPQVAGNLRIRTHFESRLSLRSIEQRGEATFAHAAHDEVLYDLGQNAGIYIPAGVPPHARRAHDVRQLAHSRHTTQPLGAR